MKTAEDMVKAGLRAAENVLAAMDVEGGPVNAFRDLRVALVRMREWVKAAREWEKSPSPAPQPIPMLLTCPSCGERHVDEGEFAERPHHTHACQFCGMVWRPALIATVGVRFLPGYRDGG